MAIHSNSVAKLGGTWKRRIRVESGTPKSGYLSTLDGWRAIAIAGVLLDHVVAYSPLKNVPKLFALSRTGPNGVSLFFAISGFLICSRLLEEQRALGQIGLRAFYIRRACRILPPALFYLSVLGVLGLFGLVILSPAEWWSSLLFFRNYLPAAWISQGWGGYTVHYWSLAVEEHFYFIWPFALVLLGKGRARWFALGLAVIIALWRQWDFHHLWFDRHLISGLLFGSRTDTRLDALLLGCLFALVLEGDVLRALFSRHFKFWMWSLCVAAYIVIQVMQSVRSYSLLESTLLPLIVAGTVYGPKTWVVGILESRAFKWVGRLSYSLYLWQQLFLVTDPTSKISFVQSLPTNLVSMFLMAWISYKFVERPFIRLGHRLAPPPTEGRDDLAFAQKKRVPSMLPLETQPPSRSSGDGAFERAE
jgi:peptidoglycan/LPS O-acetylase OafA/YrhL